MSRHCGQNHDSWRLPEDAKDEHFGEFTMNQGTGR